MEYILDMEYIHIYCLSSIWNISIYSASMEYMEYILTPCWLSEDRMAWGYAVSGTTIWPLFDHYLTNIWPIVFWPLFDHYSTVCLCRGPSPWSRLQWSNSGQSSGQSSGQILVKYWSPAKGSLWSAWWPCCRWLGSRRGITIWQLFDHYLTTVSTACIWPLFVNHIVGVWPGGMRNPSHPILAVFFWASLIWPLFDHNLTNIWSIVFDH